MKPPRRTAAQPVQPQPAQPQLVEPQIVEPQIVEIAKPVYGGSFLARVEGKAVFVPLVLPGEQVQVRITENKRGYSTADAEEIVSASPQRVKPACRHFGICGGCHYQHADYASQLAFKQAILRETLERALERTLERALDRAGVAVPEEITALSAQPLAYRNRIRLAFDAAGNPGYRGRRSHSVIPISECPIAAPLLLQAAQAAAAVARPFAPAFRPTEIALFCNADETQLLASIFTVSAKKVHFDEFAQALAEQVPALVGAELVLEGRASEQPHTVARWGAPSLLYHAAGFDYRVDRGAFFQVNRWLIDAFVERVTAGHHGALAWDLYAGVGLFARRLTASFARVIAVESAPSATQALAANLKHTTGIPVRATTLDFLRRSVKAERTSQTVPNLVVPDLIVMDPPRTGLGPEVCALLAEISAPALVYVSCDPATLARDLHALTGSGYNLQSIALADLFPQTFHLETVAVLRHS